MDSQYFQGWKDCEDPAVNSNSEAAKAIDLNELIKKLIVLEEKRTKGL
jgi:hypothetical protein